MELKDYYAILGVQPTDDLKTIKTAYRRLARKYHPDVSKENDAEAKFKDLAEAWEVLKDEQRRAEYDQLWQHRNDPGFGRQRQTHEQSYSQQDFDDIFSSMFGQQAHQRRRQHAARGHDLEIEVAVFLEETLAEQTRTISYNLPVYNVFGMIESETPKTLNVKIPAGVVDGQRIRLKGQGTPGENGGPNGDLWLVIHIAPHPLFDIVGHNLEIVLPLAPWEAALGAKVTVPTLKESILLTVPPGSQAGQRLRIKGKGLVSKTHTGDLFAVIKIVMPPKPDEKARELWQQLAAAEASFDPRKTWGESLMATVTVTFTITELCLRTGVSEEELTEIVGLGMIEPHQPQADTWLFDDSAVTIVHRAVRLRNELELDWPGIAVALTLLDENARLTRENRLLQQRLARFLAHG